MKSVSRYPHARPGASGFTLVEVMVVVIVLSIVSGMIIPQIWSSIGSTRLDASARRVASLLDFCCQAALSTGRVHGLVFTSDGKRFRVVAERAEDPQNPLGQEEATLEPVDLPGFLDEALPEDVVLNAVWMFEDELAQADQDNIRILFFPDGTTEFATLTLSNALGDQRRITLNGWSGTISIARPSQASGEGEEDQG